MSSSSSPTNWIWNNGPVGGGRAVIVDLDGVLCDADERQHLIRSGEADWQAFFEACVDDKPIEETERLLRMIATDVSIVLLTGRPIQVQAHTLQWLERYEIPWKLLIMRDRGVYADSTLFKQQSVRALRAMDFDVQIAFEDDPQNYEMFEAEGVPCHYRYSGYCDNRKFGKSKIG